MAHEELVSFVFTPKGGVRETVQTGLTSAEAHDLGRAVAWCKEQNKGVDSLTLRDALGPDYASKLGGLFVDDKLRMDDGIIAALEVAALRMERTPVQPRLSVVEPTQAADHGVRAKTNSTLSPALAKTLVAHAVDYKKQPALLRATPPKGFYLFAEKTVADHVGRDSWKAMLDGHYAAVEGQAAVHVDKEWLDRIAAEAVVTERPDMYGRKHNQRQGGPVKRW